MSSLPVASSSAGAQPSGRSHSPPVATLKLSNGTGQSGHDRHEKRWSSTTKRDGMQRRSGDVGAVGLPANCQTREQPTISRCGSRQKLRIDDFLSFSVKRSSFCNYHRGYRVDDFDRPRQNPLGFKFDKEKYLLASSQFVVLNSVLACATNPDKIIDWDLVEEIRLNTSDELVCPICLEPPIAAKITKCGHVYCWACILHYLAVSNKRYCRCPICYEIICKEDLRSVKPNIVKRYTAGESITMLLMCKSKTSLVALPVCDSRSYFDNDSLNGSGPYSQFAKVLFISVAESVSTILQRERSELEFQLATAGDEDGQSAFVLEALNDLKEREESKSLSLAEAAQRRRDRGSSKCLQSLDSAIETCNESARSDGSLDHMGSPVRSEQSDSPTNKSTEYKEYHFFYQVEDGQYIFPHLLNVRCLCYEYGGLDRAPHRICGEVLEANELMMTEKMREKYPYLTHVPLGVRLTFVELKLSPDVISPNTIQNFTNDFKRRDAIRRKKAAEEKKMERSALRWERAVMRNRNNLNEFSARRFEAGPFSNDDESPPPEGFLDDELPASENEPTSSISGSLEADGESVSFAQVLQYSKPQPVPNVVTSDEQKSPPSFKDTFASALDKVFDNLRQDPISDENGTSGKKGRKTKHRILFYT
ncbi:hypothetical protein M514_03435, partial [Trichuris suis]|uniref:E3 ubiquitin-protein ligase RNF10 n=1 Tax=Trichuris suis TaxID=68888 RepID=A0A085MEP1_9BILA